MYAVIKKRTLLRFNQPIIITNYHEESLYNGPEAVGNKTPAIEVMIHMITAINIDFNQLILYNHLKEISHTIPPTFAATSPFPSR